MESRLGAEQLEGRRVLAAADLSGGVIAMLAASDTGSSNSDAYTNIQTPQIVVTMPAGQAMTAGDAIQIYDTSNGNAVVGSYSVVAGDLNGLGVFTGGGTGLSRTIAVSSLTGGNPQLHNLRARHFDSAGNVTGSTAQSTGVLGVNIDTTAPTAPTVTSIPTNNLTPTINGTTGTGAALPAGETLSVTINGATYNNVSTTGGNWTVNLATAPSAGVLGAFVNGNSYPVTATVTDKAGNATADTTSNELSYDTTAPRVNAVAAPTNQTYLPGNVIRFTLTTDPIVFPITSGTPTIGFFIGANPRVATYNATASSATSLVFDYTVQTQAAGELNANFIAGSAAAPYTTSLTFNANNAQDAAGNTLTLSGGVGSLATTYTLTVFVGAVPTTSLFTNPPTGPIAVPMPVVGISFNQGVAVGAGPGLLGLDDFQLSRDGSPVAINGTLNYNQANPSPTQFSISDLDDETSALGTYILTFTDVGVANMAQMTWVKSIASPFELSATITPLLGNSTAVTSGTITQTPVDSVKVLFSSDVNNVTTGITGAAITQFQLMRNGISISWPSTATVSQVSSKEYRISGLSSLASQAGSYQVIVGPTSGISTPSSPSSPTGGTTPGAQLMISYGASWRQADLTTASVAFPATGSYTLDQKIVFTATFTDKVTITGTPSIPCTLTTSSGTTASRPAKYLSGDKTSTLTFAYTVTSSDNEPDNIIVPGSFDVTAGTIKDSLGFDVVPVFTSVNGSNVIKVDGKVPAILATGGVNMPAGGVYSSATPDKISFIVNFDDAVSKDECYAVLMKPLYLIKGIA
jgi:hypothetical protein